jgi:hypothetical protein
MARGLGWPIVAVLLALSSACIYASMPKVVRERMALDYNCQGDITVTDLPASAYRATGCGFTATYVCSVPNGVLACIKEAGSSPVPMSVEDAGVK